MILIIPPCSYFLFVRPDTVEPEDRRVVLNKATIDVDDYLELHPT